MNGVSKKGLHKASIVAMWGLIVLLVIIESNPALRFGRAVEFETIDVPSYYSEEPIQGNLVINSQVEFDAMWARINQSVMPSPPPPQIDFDSKTVIGVFWGAKPTGGYSLQIDRITESNGELTVHVTKRNPDSVSVTTQMMTFPSHLVMLDKTPKNIDFDEREVTSFYFLPLAYWLAAIIALINVPCTLRYFKTGIRTNPENAAP